MPNRIMFVDDDPTMRGLMSAFAQMLGASTVEVNTAAGALDYLAQHGHNGDAPRMIVVDIDLPDMDGITLCQVLADREIFPLDHVIVLSATTTAEDRLRIKALGTRRHLHKPFLLEDLREALSA